MALLSSPTTTITASLLGQPPTVAMAGSDCERHSIDTDESSSDIGVTKVLKVLRRVDDSNDDASTNPFVVDPHDFILKERLDEKECLLMNGRPPPMSSS